MISSGVNPTRGKKALAPVIFEIPFRQISKISPFSPQKNMFSPSKTNVRVTPLVKSQCRNYSSIILLRFFSKKFVKSHSFGMLHDFLWKIPWNHSRNYSSILFSFFCKSFVKLHSFEMLLWFLWVNSVK